MPRRDDIRHVMVIGSGPIVIGQAAEFDYSGTQACRVLRAEGLRVSLVNSNPATIMTDPEFADATYVEPVTPEFLEQVIAAERPDAILATLGGQTALNAAIALHENGVLERYGVELIGADVDAIQRGEDRLKFKEIVQSIGGDVPRSAVCHSMDEVRAAASELGLPVVIRPSFTMGGLGSGMAHTPEDLERLAGTGLDASPVTEVLIENLDPMGVHTGDSITVAPAMTLTDREFQRMRDVGIDVLRAVGVDTGGCNIQFAVHPDTGRLVVIEMNPRVSRSSALASKATGFPIAKIAARLAIGYTLDEIRNDITGETPAAFEPTLDYVVVKIPRFAFEKFPGADPELTTTMKSVGEAMALGRSFPEALGKAMRSMETSRIGFWTAPDPDDEPDVAASRDGRIYAVEHALRRGRSVADVAAASGIDPWFVDQIAALTERGGAGRGAAAAGEAGRAVGPPDRGAAPRVRRRGRCALPAPPPGHPPGLQDRGHLRRGVRGEDALPLQRLRDRPERGVGDRRADREAEGAHPRVRAQPHRAGHRVRLLVRARGDGAAGGRVRDRDGQLQSGDRLHRLRHGRPALLRAAHVRGRARGGARRAAVRHGRGRHRAAGRADPARARAAAHRGGRAGRRHVGGGHRPGRGPRCLR
jgi:carbamoylphosphate synthase large subunit